MGGKMSWEAAKEVQQHITIWTKEELLECNAEELEKLDNKVWEYWKKIRAVQEFRRLD